MNKILSTAMFLLTVLCSPVLAQDASDWLGGYYGFSLGFVDGSPEHSWAFNTVASEVDVSGFALGASYGRNYANNSMVYGFETDINISNADGFTIGTETPCITTGEACNNKLNAYASLRGRVGAVMENGLLVYGTLGAAAGDIEASADTGACGNIPCTLDEVRLGWTAGVGFEKMLENSWNLKAEYLYMDFGDEQLDGSAFGQNVRAEFNYSVIRVGLTKRF